jgi:hypothetical protein
MVPLTIQSQAGLERSAGHLSLARMVLANGPRGRSVWSTGVVADIRSCEQCGISFMPRREHARFCCVRCRVMWNREHMGDLKAGASALQWAITAMDDTTGRLPQVGAWDRPRGFALIGEAVWWVTIVDATLVRHHAGVYDAAMAGQAPPQRQLVEETLAGLRFVRNQIGGKVDIDEFIEPGGAGPGAAEEWITDWRWKPVHEPGLASLPRRRQMWEMTRYQAYQARLAAHTIGEVFGPAAAFLKLAAACAPSIADATVHAGR